MIMHQAFYQTICRYSEGDLAGARAAAGSIAADGELYAQAARWLDKVAHGGEIRAYVDADAFGIFVRTGGNVALYAALEKMIAAAWNRFRPATILDVGPGDGRVVTGALRHTQLRPLPGFDLVEPAANLLLRVEKELNHHVPPVTAQGFEDTIQSFAKQTPTQARWDLCQATWSLHNLSPAERGAVFRWLSDCCATLLLAEFDVRTEEYPMLSPERVRLVHDRYLAGVAEYTGRIEPALEEQVKQGFLMPILFGYFRSDASRSTFEQSLDAWSAELAAAGFQVVHSDLIYRYWWADAYLLTARS
jgi:hypothetical protein